MKSVPTGTVYLAALCLLAAAVLGFWTGYTRSETGGSRAPDLAALGNGIHPVPAVDADAKPTLDEDAIRRIAHEEAIAAVVASRPAPKKTPKPTDTPDAADEAATDEPAAPPAPPTPVPPGAATPSPAPPQP